MNGSDTYVLSFWTARVWEFILGLFSQPQSYIDSGRLGYPTMTHGYHGAAESLRNEGSGRVKPPVGGQPKAAADS